MASLKTLSIGRGQETFYLDPDTIIEDKEYNCRDMESESTKAHILQMFEALKAGGVTSFPPISVYKDTEDGIHLVVGHCRVRAFRMAKAAGLPIKGVLAVANNQSEEERVIDLINSNSQLPLTPLEKATVVQRLLGLGLTQADIARRLGKSQTAVADLIAILEAPESVKEMIQSGAVSATLVSETLKSDPDNAEQKITKAVKKAKDSGKTKATKKDIEEDVDIIPKKCPFCGEKLVEIDDLEHPLNGCILEGFAFGLDKLKAWNRRSK
jgi:ParB family chromosome partitioning protein